MTRLRVEVRYALRVLWVRPDVLGTSYTWTEDGREVTLALPNTPEDFINADETEVPLVPAWVPTAVIEGSGVAAAIQLIRTETTVEAEVSAEHKTSIDFDSEDDDEAERARMFSGTTHLAFREGVETIEKALRAWLSHIRSQGSQPWLGVVAELPPQYGRGHVFDIAAGSRLMSFGPEQRATIRSAQVALTPDVLDEIVTRLQAGEGPDVARSLLADARFLSQEAETRDPQRAVLIAAAAAEIKAKNTMRNKVPAPTSQTSRPSPTPRVEPPAAARWATACRVRRVAQGDQPRPVRRSQPAWTAAEPRRSPRRTRRRKRRMATCHRGTVAVRLVRRTREPEPIASA